MVKREVLELIREIRQEKVADKAAAATTSEKKPDSEEMATLVARGGNPLAGQEFKQSLPVIKDSDLGLERHLLDFRAIVDCYALTRREGVRPYDLLVVFRRTLAAGSTRRKIYEKVVAKAIKDNRLPFQEQAVYDEVISKLRYTIREGKLQKQTRIENDLEVLRALF